MPCEICKELFKSGDKVFWFDSKESFKSYRTHVDCYLPHFYEKGGYGFEESCSLIDKCLQCIDEWKIKGLAMPNEYWLNNWIC